MSEFTKKIVELYALYIQGLKRLSQKERDEISRVFLKYKNAKKR